MKYELVRGILVDFSVFRHCSKMLAKGGMSSLYVRREHIGLGG